MITDKISAYASSALLAVAIASTGVSVSCSRPSAEELLNINKSQSVTESSLRYQLYAMPLEDNQTGWKIYDSAIEDIAKARTLMKESTTWNDSNNIKAGELYIDAAVKLDVLTEKNSHIAPDAKRTLMHNVNGAAIAQLAAIEPDKYPQGIKMEVIDDRVLFHDFYTASGGPTRSVWGCKYDIFRTEPETTHFGKGTYKGTRNFPGMTGLQSKEQNPSLQGFYERAH